MTLEGGVVLTLWVFAVGLAAFALGLTRSIRGVDLRTVNEEPRGLDPGSLAPVIELPSVAGDVVRLPQSSRPAIIMFASATCHDCHAVAPIVDQLRAQVGAELDVHIIVAGDVTDVRKFAAETAVHGEVLTDPVGEGAHRYGARRVPLGVFVGADGVIQQSTALTAANAGALLAEFVRQCSVASETV